MENWHPSLCKNEKMSLISWKFIIQQNFKLLTPQSLGLCFSEWGRNGKLQSAIMKIWKMAPILQKTAIQQNFKLLIPPKSLVSAAFLSEAEMENWS